MSDKKELVLLFSGGTDSTCTAVLMQDKYEKIHLITYDRFGLLNTKNSQNSALKLKKKFGQNKFIHTIINIDKMFKKISYVNYFRDILKYKFFLLLTCGLCKLAMHWQTIIYCLNNNVDEVCDGSNQEIERDPSQNELILKEMRLLYKEFKINYFNPVFYDSREKREKLIFDLQLTPVQHPKWTSFSWEMQPFCPQEYLFNKFYIYATTNWRGEITMQRSKRYEEKMLEYHRGKRDFIKKEIYKYLREKTAQGPKC